MYSLIFGLFALALLLFYGTIQTFSFVKKLKETKYRRKYTRYGTILGFYGSISFILGVVFYYYGVG